MKYLIISNLWGSEAVGGAEKMALAEAVELKNSGHDVVVVTARAVSVFARVAVEGEFRVWRFFPLNLFFYKKLGGYGTLVRLLWHVIDLFSFNGFFAVRSVIKREKPDQIISHNVKGLGMSSLLAVRFSGIPHTHVVHDVQLVTPSGLLWWESESRDESVMTAMYRTVLKFFVGSPMTVRFLSAWCKDIHDQYGFFSRSQKIVAQEKVASKPRPQVIKNILFVGQIELHKGIALLIDEMKSFPQLKLHVYGDGNLRVELEKNSQSNVMWHGKATHEQLERAYQTADAIIVPSLVHENSPRVIVEAGRHHLTIVASRVGGVPEMVDEHAILFDPTPEGLREALRLLTMRGENTKISKDL